MKNIYFGDYEEFALDAMDKLDAISQVDEFNDVAIVAKYEEARHIIERLINCGCSICNIELHDEDWCNYTSEYIVSIRNNGEEYELWCEPMIKEKGYLTEESTVIYVLDNCSSKVIPYCKGQFVYEATVGESACEDDYNEEYDCDCCECCDSCTMKTDNKNTKSVASTTPVIVSGNGKYYVNGKPVSKETWEKKKKLISETIEEFRRDFWKKWLSF